MFTGSIQSGEHRDDPVSAASISQTLLALSLTNKQKKLFK